jgi:hypothetical protein
MVLLSPRGAGYGNEGGSRRIDLDASILPQPFQHESHSQRKKVYHEQLEIDCIQ